MDVGEPSAAICPSLDGPVLRVLAGTRLPLSARAVSRLAKRGSAAGINRTLQRLSEHGLVTGVEAGRAVLYSLNRKHIGAPIVELLADLRSELLRRIMGSMALWECPPMFATLFGSAARGDGDTGSDIDIFLVRPLDVGRDQERWAHQVQQLAADVYDWTGNHASVIEVGAAELYGPGAPDIERFVSSIRSDWIVLVGDMPIALDAVEG